jgi:hypothetical protein
MLYVCSRCKYGALREVYPGVSFGSFIKKPVEIEYLAKRLLAELS